jgi:peptidoglycan/LPS O-acetylase OafA/YrhL
MFKRPSRIPDVLNSKVLPSLDGFRALSIMIVIICHVLMSFKTPYDFHPLANLGVQFFFVISGFLITTLLIKEQLDKGSINLKNFYIRRAIRILPVAYLFLGIVVLLNFILRLHLDYFLIIAAFLFIRNFFVYSEGVNHLTTHYWSLSVEEQFYIVFPVILKKNLSVYFYFLLLVLLSALLQSFLPDNLNTGATAVIIQFITQFQGIATGSLASILLFKGVLKPEGWLSRRTAISALSFFLIFFLLFFHHVLPNLVLVLQSFLFSIVLILCLHESKTNLLFKALNYRHVKTLGLISYSLYIWQQPFTLNLSFLESRNLLSADNIYQKIFVVLTCLAVLISVSYFSYFYFEKRLLKYRSHFK